MAEIRTQCMPCAWKKEFIFEQTFGSASSRLNGKSTKLRRVIVCHIRLLANSFSKPVLLKTVYKLG